MVALPSDILIRRAEARDAFELGELGATLMRVHYAFDPLRFLEPGGGDEGGYARFLTSQLDEDDAIVYVAERRRHIVGYVYAAVEPLSWKDLRDEAGFIHDLLVSVDAASLGRRRSAPRSSDRVAAGARHAARGARHGIQE